VSDVDWELRCSACDEAASAAGLPTVCGRCGEPWLVIYPARQHPRAARDGLVPNGGVLRYRRFLPLLDGEVTCSLGEGGTPLLRVPRLGSALGVDELYVKDESPNPTGSFKARGLMLAITRAAAAGVSAFVLPTAGNAGVAAAAYAARAGIPARVFAPRGTPEAIVRQIQSYGAALELVEGHIGDCGQQAAMHARSSGAFLLSTLREPYRIEGKKTLGYEIAEALGWRLPDVVVYPAGGGTGLIAMWLAFRELLAVGWVSGRLPRLFAVQSTGCAPVVRAWLARQQHCDPWPKPATRAHGLRVPSPLGGRLMLTAIRASRGGAAAVSDRELLDEASRGNRLEGIDFCPEGGATLAGLRELRQHGFVRDGELVVAFNTGGGWLYR
jgi:threonine synthase